MLDGVCEMASRAGLAAKLTGAGGGGCAIVLVPPGRDGREGGREGGGEIGWMGDRVSITSCFLLCLGFSESRLREAKDAFTAAGFDCWETTIGSRGVCLHCDIKH